MERVKGIGGIFFRGDDQKSLLAWYRDHLGIESEAWGGLQFNWRQADDPDRPGSTTWSIFPKDSKYFGDSSNKCMINYRVDDLDKMLAQLRAAGVDVDEHIEESEYGRFGWATDPEGNRLEDLGATAGHVVGGPKGQAMVCPLGVNSAGRQAKPTPHGTPFGPPQSKTCSQDWVSISYS